MNAITHTYTPMRTTVITGVLFVLSFLALPGVVGANESQSSVTEVAVESTIVAETLVDAITEVTATSRTHSAPYQGCMMEISKSASISNPKVGDTITYTINVKNTGTGNCTGGGVKIADILSSDVTYVSETHASNITAGYHEFGTYHAQSHVVYWNADTLTPGESGWVTVTVRVKERHACGNFTVSNKAKVTSYELNNFTKWIESNVVTTGVENACPTPDPVCTLVGTPATIVRGGSASLTWTTGNADTRTIDGGVGSVGVTGSVSVSPVATTQYTLTALGGGKTVTCPFTVTVTTPEEPAPLTCDAFTATPATRTSAGPVTLTWATTNAASVSIDNGVGTVDADGTKEVTVSANTTYTLTATRGTETKTCTTGVTIVPPTTPTTPRCDAFTVSDNSVRRGESVTLTWNTTDVATATIDNNIGAVDVDGTRAVTINDPITYTLTGARGSEIVTCAVSIDIESSGGGGGGGSSAPRCELKASDTKVKAGEKVTLSWKNVRTNDIVLKDNRGTELIDTTEAADEKLYSEDEDTFDVRPAKTTTYTLTAYKGTRSKTCTVEIEVESISISSTRSNTPIVAGISLSRLPYTGFDAGPFLTTVFYTLLVLWALAVAYILVIRRESVLGVSLKSGGRTIGSVEPAMVMPTLGNGKGGVPEVSRMEYVPSVIAAPRILPSGDMATKHAPVGYDALYEGYGEAPEAVSRVSDVPNLPIGEFESTVSEVSTNDTDLLEARAHDASVLISTDALNFIIAQSKNTRERVELLDMVIGAAKAHYPKEDGWVVVNKEKILSLLK
jgi:uncharacterized repeat protein (TIGR01451 family)